MQEPKFKENVRVRKENASGDWGIPDRSVREERVKARGLHSLHEQEHKINETRFQVRRELGGETRQNRREYYYHFTVQ